MSRTLVPLGAIAGFWAALRSWPADLGLEVDTASVVGYASRALLATWSTESAGEASWGYLFQLGAALVILQSHRELAIIFRAGLELLYHILAILIYLLQWTLSWLRFLGALGGFWGHSWGTGLSAAERGEDLTWHSMAAAAAAAPLPVGTFVLISRPPEWDEVYVTGFSAGGAESLCRTTTQDGADWQWVLIQIVGLHMRLPVTAANGARQAPNGVDPNAVNWVCTPPAGNAQWIPQAAEVVNLTAEAGLILAQFNGGTTNWPINIPGVGGPLIAINTVLGGPVGPGGAGVVAGGALPAGGAGLGLGGGEAAAAASSNAELKALEAAVQQLQAMALSPTQTPKHSSKKKKKKKSKKDRKDKKRKKSSSSSGSSSSSRSRSRSSSSSSGKKSKPLRWNDQGKDRRVAQADLSHVDMLKWKKRGDLIAFAHRHPGALTAHFLASVYSRLSKGTVTRSAQLREASVTSWAHQFSGLSEIRDVKEVLTLAEVLDAVNRKEIAQAMDILCQRILAVQAAKQKGGSWERAEAIELVDNRKTLASSSMLALTNTA